MYFILKREEWGQGGGKYEEKRKQNEEKKKNLDKIFLKTKTNLVRDSQPQEYLREPLVNSYRL